MNILSKAKPMMRNLNNIKKYTKTCTSSKEPILISYYPCEKIPHYLISNYTYYPNEKFSNYTNIDYQYHLRIYNQKNNYNSQNYLLNYDVFLSQ